MNHLKLKTILVLCISFSLFCISCKKDQVFSCDKELNDYAKKTMSSNQNISRDSLAKLGLDTQFAVFNSLHSLNKARVFKEKIAILLNDRTISNTDKDHLSNLYDYIGEDIYDNNDTDTFITSWISSAYNVLHWDSLKMFSFVETWMTPSEIQSIHNMYVYNSADNCVCNSRFACNFGLSGCPEGGCSNTTDGCGILGSNPCKGTCASWSN